MVIADFVALSQDCAPRIAVPTMAALVQTESGFRPFAIGVNHGPPLSRQPATRQQAIRAARSLLARGYSIDVGLAQINSANLAGAGLSLDQSFDPCRNLAAAASMLRRNYSVALHRYAPGQPALRAALSMYNSGSPARGVATGYVSRVLAHARGWRAYAATAPIADAVPAIRQDAGIDGGVDASPDTGDDAGVDEASATAADPSTVFDALDAHHSREVMVYR